MKLLTLNCHSWQEDNQLYKIKEIAKAIVENNYDVVALQEVSQLMNNKLVYDNVREGNFILVLQEELKNLGCSEYRFYWDMVHFGFKVYEEGICILTKLPIKDSKTFLITKGNDIHNFKTRKIVKITTEYKNQDIDIYCCHLGWWNDEDESFKYQVDTLLKNTTKDKLNIFMGDFNNDANIRNEGYDYLIKSGLKDTYILANQKDSGITVCGKIDGWEKNKEDMRLDLILTNKIVDVEYSRVIFNNKNKEVVSDHFGVEVKLV